MSKLDKHGKKIEKLIEKLENNKITVATIFFIISIIVLRNFLEVFSDTNLKFTYYAHYLLHYPLFYIMVFFSMIILLHLITREKIIKIANLAVYFFPIILIAPIIDIFFGGNNINYIYGTGRELLFSFLSFAGPTVAGAGGASIGIKIEILLLLIFAAYYVFYKTKNIGKTILTPILAYIIIFILAALPQLFAHFVGLFGQGELVELFNQATFNVVYHPSIKISMILAPILLLILIAFYYFYNSEKIKSLLLNIRIERLLHYLLLMVIGMLLGYYFYSGSFNALSPFTYLIFLSAIISLTFTWMTAVNINDIADIKLDKITNKKRPLPQNIFSLDSFKKLTIFYFLASLYFALLINVNFMLLILVLHAISFIYSCEPLRLKRVPIISKFLIASASMISILLGFIIFSVDTLALFPTNLYWIVLLSYTIGANIIDIKDVKSDKRYGILTLPALLGDKSRFIIGLLVFALYIIIPWIVGLIPLIPIGFIFGAYTFYQLTRPRINDKLIFAIYLLFLIIGIIIYIIM